MTTTQYDTNRTNRTRPPSLWAYVAGTLALGLTALFGGGRLVLDPTGRSMNMPVEWLAGTPFDDYLLPGLVLFSLLGVGSFVVLYGIARHRPWARRGALALGVSLVTLASRPSVRDAMTE